MFGYGCWKAKLGSDIDFKWLALLVFGGLVVLTYGVYLISDTPDGSQNIIEEFNVQRIRPAMFGQSFSVLPPSDSPRVAMPLSRPSPAHQLQFLIPRVTSSCQL